MNAPANPAAFYQSQTSGHLAEIVDSVFYNNNAANAYTEATARGVFAPANNNVQEPANSPITSITRAAAVVKGGKVMEQVISLDPRPANDALTSVGYAPYDGFFSSAHYRGAFAPGNNWLAGWTASTAYGFTPNDRWCDLGGALPGFNGDPILSGTGTLMPGSPTTLSLSNVPAGSGSAIAIGINRIDLPLFGGTLIPDVTPPGLVFAVPTGSGSITLPFNWPVGLPSGTTFYLQAWTLDTAGHTGFLSATNGLAATTP